jgi:small subunit ribosomal protein S1
MSNDERPSGDEDLEREIAEALGDNNVLEIAGRELFAPTERKEAEVRPGSFQEGVISAVGQKDIFLEFGPRLQGVVSADQFSELPEVGTKVRVFIEDHDTKENLFLCSLRRGVQAGAWEGLEPGSLLVGEVKATNKGGLELLSGVLSLFLPVSHIELDRVEDMEPYLGQRLEVEVVEVDRERRKIVVSRRALLARARDAKRSEAVGQLTVGTIVPGKVTRIEPFGAFVDLGSVEGLLHVSQMAWKRVENPADHVSVGDDLKVQILDIQEEGRRLSLSLTVLQDDPWDVFVRENPVGTLVPGKVTRIATYGAFVEVADGVEGLAHVSQLAPGSVNTPRDVVRLGQELKIRVAEIDPERRRIGLSLLTDRGDRLTDDVADDATIQEVMHRDRPAEPTLGDLLKKALEGKG